MAFSALPFWPKDKIEESDDGYIILKDGWNAGEDQPLLLHSTRVVLNFLCPGMDIHDILVEAESMLKLKGGRESSLCELEKSNTETQAKGKSSSALEREYETYQSMERVTDLSNRLQSAILDIQRCRHRSKTSNENPSNETKVGDFEKDEDDTDMTGVGPVVSQNEKSEDGTFEEHKNHGEIETVRLVRTLNSVRALFPHLISILNHKRRNDKKLQIQNTKWKSKRRRAMCWIIGRYVYDTTTVNWCKNAHRDVATVLHGYIDVSLAETVLSDPQGSFEFWKNHWLSEVQKRMTPKVMYPLDILSQDKSRDEIMQTARELDQKLFSTETNKATLETQRKYRQCINNLRDHILKLLRKRYSKARLSLYGSCLSNLSLGAGSDVDLSLWIPIPDEAKMDRKETVKHVYKVFHILNNRDGFAGLQPITRARVPVVKGRKINAGNPFTPDGSIDFDICFLNDIAVANSSLLREYSLVDSRVRDFMLQVKFFCRYHGINSSPSGTISSYAWNVLCIFYLQWIEFIPNLQDRTLMDKVNKKPNPRGNYWHRVDDLDTFYLKWSDVEGVWKRPEMYNSTTVSLLLYGFFEFYTNRFPGAFFSISIRHGGLSLSKLSGRASSFLSIEDPFEAYDSWKPHDLGSHASDNGANKILCCVKDGEKFLRNLLLGLATDGDSSWKQSGERELQDAETPPAFRKSMRDTRATVRKKGTSVATKETNEMKKTGNNVDKSRQQNQMDRQTKHKDNSKKGKKAPQQKRKNEPQRVPKSQEKDSKNGKVAASKT